MKHATVMRSYVLITAMKKKSKIRIVWWRLCYFVVGWVGFGGFLH